MTKRSTQKNILVDLPYVKQKVGELTEQVAVIQKAGIDPATVEVLANKQDDLTVDGTGTKYATIDVVNAALGDIESILLSI